MVVIEESEMSFQFEDVDKVYQIEKDSFYKNRSSKYGEKDVDFIFLKDRQLFFIEAKKSVHQDLEKYITELSKKLIDSLNIYSAILSNKLESREIPDTLNNLLNLRLKLKYIIIIKNVEKQSLPPIRDALNKKLKQFSTLFEISIFVFNQEQAISKGLVKEQ
jgi:hypothetical protein